MLETYLQTIWQQLVEASVQLGFQAQPCWF